MPNGTAALGAIGFLVSGARVYRLVCTLLQWHYHTARLMLDVFLIYIYRWEGVHCTLTGLYAAFAAARRRSGALLRSPPESFAFAPLMLWSITMALPRLFLSSIVILWTLPGRLSSAVVPSVSQDNVRKVGFRPPMSGTAKMHAPCDCYHAMPLLYTPHYRAQCLHALKEGGCPAVYCSVVAAMPVPPAPHQGAPAHATLHFLVPSACI